MLGGGQLPEAPEGFLTFQCSPGGIPPEIAEDDQAAQPRNHIHKMIVEALFLRYRSDPPATDDPTDSEVVQVYLYAFPLLGEDR